MGCLVNWITWHNLLILGFSDFRSFRFGMWISWFSELDFLDFLIVLFALIVTREVDGSLASIHGFAKEARVTQTKRHVDPNQLVLR